MSQLKSLLILAAIVALSAATFDCIVPISASAGCAECFEYRFEDVETGETEQITRPATADECRQELLDSGLDPVVVNGWDDQLVLVLCITKSITEDIPITEKQCIVNSTVAYSHCIASNDTAFVVKTPNLTGAGANPVACFWNTPTLEMNHKIYADTLRMDIAGNPATSCDDKLIMESDSANEDRVACGTADEPVFYNEIVTNRLEPFFMTNNSVTKSGAEVLFIYYEEPSRKRSAAILHTNNNTANVDLCAEPKVDSTVHPVCTCKNLTTDIHTLCSNESLQANPYYQKYLDEYDNILHEGIYYGFRGYKGCLGAEFFRCDGFVQSLTEDECKCFKLGMTPAEADRFLEIGASMWNLVGQATKDPASVCDDSVTSTIPNGQEHIQLQDLVVKPTAAKATGCLSATNKILKIAAEYVDNYSKVPHFFDNE